MKTQRRPLPPVTVTAVKEGGTLASKVTPTSGVAQAARSVRKFAEVKELLHDLKAEDAEEMRNEVLRIARRQVVDEPQQNERRPCRPWRRHRTEAGCSIWVPKTSAPSGVIASPLTRELPRLASTRHFTVSESEWAVLSPRSQQGRSYEQATLLVSLAAQYGENFSVIYDRHAAELGCDASVAAWTLEAWYAALRRRVLMNRVERAIDAENKAKQTPLAELATALRTVSTKISACFQPISHDECTLIGVDNAHVTDVMRQLREESDRISRQNVELENLESEVADLKSRAAAVRVRVSSDMSLSGVLTNALSASWNAGALVCDSRQDSYNAVGPVPTIMNDVTVLTLRTNVDRLHLEVEVALEGIVDEAAGVAAPTPRAIELIDTIRCLLTANAVMHRVSNRLHRLRSDVDKLKLAVDAVLLVAP